MGNKVTIEWECDRCGECAGGQHPIMNLSSIQPTQSPPKGWSSGQVCDVLLCPGCVADWDAHVQDFMVER